MPVTSSGASIRNCVYIRISAFLLRSDENSYEQLVGNVTSLYKYNEKDEEEEEEEEVLCEMNDGNQRP